MTSRTEYKLKPRIQRQLTTKYGGRFRCNATKCPADGELRAGEVVLHKPQNGGVGKWYHKNCYEEMLVDA